MIGYHPDPKGVLSGIAHSAASDARSAQDTLAILLERVRAIEMMVYTEVRDMPCPEPSEMSRHRAGCPQCHGRGWVMKSSLA